MPRKDHISLCISSKNKTVLVVLIYLISLSSSSIRPLTNIKNCVCANSLKNCISVAKSPLNILSYCSFNTHSPLDNYGNSYVRESHVSTSFGRRNQGKSLKFAGNSKVVVTSLKAGEISGITAVFWIKMGGRMPYVYSSIAQIAAAKTPFENIGRYIFLDYNVLILSYLL